MCMQLVSLNFWCFAVVFFGRWMFKNDSRLWSLCWSYLARSIPHFLLPVKTKKSGYMGNPIPPAFDFDEMNPWCLCETFGHLIFLRREWWTGNLLRIAFDILQEYSSFKGHLFVHAPSRWRLSMIWNSLQLAATLSRIMVMFLIVFVFHWLLARS